MDIRLKRAYEPAAPADGYRVLIDRLWPRGVSRQRAKLDGWEKELAPSTDLRRWFGHDPRRFEEFRRRYIDELRDQRPRLTALGRGRARSRSSSPLTTPSTTTPSSSPRPYGVASRGVDDAGATAGTAGVTRLASP